MRNQVLVSVLCSISFAATPFAAAAVMRVSPTATSAAAVVPGEVLVRFRPTSEARAVATPGDAVHALSVKSRLGLALQERLLSGRIERLRLPAYLRVEDAVAQLAADPAVLWAEPNWRRVPHEVLPNDPSFAQQWPLKNTGQSGADGAGTAGADLAGTFANDVNDDGIADRTDSRAVRIALIDDGFELSHPDLRANFNTALARDFSANGSEDNDPSPGSNNDTHGTLVAGSAGAVGNNGIGISALAWRSELLPIRFAFDVASEVKALDYARAQGAKVVNASFGSPAFSNAERDALQLLADADILFVASAGNLDSNTDFAVAAYPANYDLPNIVAVAASDRRDALASFSQYGPISVDVAAPGVQVLTTAVGGNYSTVSGTSFSAPYTAAVAALIRATYPGADVGEVKARLIEGAERGNGVDSFVAGGRVDADNSLDLAARPALVIRSLRFDDTGSGDSDGVLDPGESLFAEVTVQNLWSAATGVSGRLSTTSGSLSVGATAVTVASIGRNDSAVLRFPFTVASTANAHEIVDFTLQLGTGTYGATRHFNAELGRLERDVVSRANLSTGPREEFHTWQFDLPAGGAAISRLIVNSTADRDIDLLVKQGSPARYEISLDVDPESGGQTFFADIPEAQIGGGVNGNETVTISNPARGPWFVTVVNYTQTANQPYTLKFSTTAETAPTAPSPAPAPAPSGGGGGGGGLLAPGLLVAGLARRLALRARAGGLATPVALS